MIPEVCRTLRLRAVRRKSDRLQGSGPVSEDQKQSFEDELISAFLTKSTVKARQQIADEGKLPTENAFSTHLSEEGVDLRPTSRNF